MKANHFLRRILAAITLALALSACDQIGAPLITNTPPSCRSERAVASWIVAAEIAGTPSDTSFINRWEARRNFSTFFGMRVTFDTNESATPYLQIWHDYKTGEFVMRLEGDKQFRMMLDSRYAVTRGTFPDGAFEMISKQPVRIEHTSHTNKWSVYQTDDLPEAIAAAVAELTNLKRKLATGECTA